MEEQNLNKVENEVTLKKVLGIEGNLADGKYKGSGIEILNVLKIVLFIAAGILLVIAFINWSKGTNDSNSYFREARAVEEFARAAACLTYGIYSLLSAFLITPAITIVKAAHLYVKKHEND